MRVGVASSEPETGDPVEFWSRCQALGLKEARLVAYRNNPALLDRIREALACAPSRMLVSLVLIDGPSEPLAGFPEWAAQVARRFPRIYRFIVWNEPNTWAWQHGPGPYADLLHDATAAIRQVRARAIVSGFGLARSGRPIWFLQMALKRLDVAYDEWRPPSLSAHLYPGSGELGNQGALQFLRRQQQLLPGVPVHVDELGWRLRSGVGEPLQARRTDELLRALRRNEDVRCALLYRLQDGEGWTAGPYRSDGTRRPLWRVLRAAATLKPAG